MALLLFGSASESDLSFFVGDPDDQVDFTGVLGAVADAYQAVGAFPSPWVLDSASGVLTVRKNVPLVWTGIVQALEGAGTFPTVSFTISVQNHVRYLGPDPPNRSDPIGTVVSFNAASLYIGATSYSLSLGTLPAGLTLNTTTGMITGTVTTARAAATVVIRGTGPADSSDAHDFTWAVTAVMVPPVLIAAIGNQAIALGSAIAAINSGSTNFTGGVSYALSSAIAGCSFNTSTGALTGTPSSAGLYLRTITATSSDGSTLASNQFSILVTSAAPVFSGSVADIVKAVGQPVDVSFAPFFTNGVSYTISITPSTLGLSFDLGTGRLTGAINAAGSTANVKVTATNPSGSTQTNGFAITGTAATTQLEVFPTQIMLLS